MQTALFSAAAIVGILASVAGASAENRKVNVINETSVPLVEFYASNVGTDDWQEDILGQDVLAAGQSVMINIDDGTGYCKYDFKGVFDDGDEVVKEGIDVCETGSFRFTE